MVGHTRFPIDFHRIDEVLFSNYNESMAYLIDGHNLIPKIPGLSLQAVDDENQLILMLQEFCRIQRKPVEVYFDNGPIGQPKSGQFGLVKAHFVRRGTTADQAIHNRLVRLGKEARNWTLVSSDLAVQNSARLAHAHYISSEAFARLLAQVLAAADKKESERTDGQLSGDDLEEWLHLFGAEDDSKSQV